ncbi:MAG: primosomal protein N' [candidate division Zixibacteria bacterium]|nr:primosomal protein N' [candidate division Zixibacteria bacterium]
MVPTARFATIAVSGPLRRSFTYRIPDHIGAISPGQRVLVPFGRAQKVGFFIEQAEPPAGIDVKNISRLLDEASCFEPELFEFCRWMADYYFANPADCFASALPSVLKTHRKAGLVWGPASPAYLPRSFTKLVKPGKKLSRKTIQKLQSLGLLARLVKEGGLAEDWPVGQSERRERVSGFKVADPGRWSDYYSSSRFHPEVFDGVKARAELKEGGWSDYQIRKAVRETLLAPVYSEETVLDFILPRLDVRHLQLNEQQREAVSHLLPSLDSGFAPFLLHGVTGSGKTLVYCHVCRELIKTGRSALVLTPEIALSGTTLAYFRGFFGDEVTVIHSAINERERLESWRGIRSGKYKIVVGPRSALFAPLPKPGLIIVDEEHDSSYKQTSPSPRFHGRDAAIMRAKINDIPVLLGSASPSMESYHHARTGRYRLLTLTQRPAGATLPEVRVIDLRTERLRGDLQYLSYPLKREVERRLDNREQVILYLNRRGHSPMLKCADCGHVPKCPRCQVKLTYHRIGSKLTCHYCGYLAASYDTCEHCRGREFLYLGVGTQKVEENLPRLFAKARAVRLDSDSAGGRRKAHIILSDFARQQSNLLLGTQMVTKGLDLPGVTLVGVLSTDLALDLPDFRASEKAFAKLLQVAGRSGRAGKPGEVLIQTYYPDSPVIRDAARQDYHGFYEREITSRQALSYPPFSRLVNIVLTANDEAKLEEAARSFREKLSQQVHSAGVAGSIMGPAPCPMYYLRGSYRRQVLCKTTQIVKLVKTLTAWEERSPRFDIPSRIKISVDVDPDDMM